MYTLDVHIDTFDDGVYYRICKTWKIPNIDLSIYGDYPDA
jgi:hypothetical protein